MILRDATAADLSALAALHVQTFTETHRGGRPGGPTLALRTQQWQVLFAAADDGRFCVVLEEAPGQLVGFARGTPHDGGVPGFEGELDKIYLLQRVQRRGLGRRLLAAVAHRFLARGITSMVLFGEATLPANAFYEALGAERLYSPKGEFHGGYGWRDLRALLERCEARGKA